MGKIEEIFSWIVDILTKVTGWIAALSLIAAALIVTEAVIVRKIFNISTVWQTEAGMFLLIYVVFTGAAFVQLNEHHLNVDLVIIHMSPRRREKTIIASSILSCFLAMVLAWYAWPMWWESVIKNEHTESLWGPPLWIPYLFLPLGMTILSLQYIVYIRKKIAALKSGDFDKEVQRFELRDIEIKKTGDD